MVYWLFVYIILILFNFFFKVLLMFYEMFRNFIIDTIIWNEYFF